MKVLVDRNIEINAVTHKTVMVPQVVRWGPHNQTLPVAQRVHFPPAGDFRTEQLPYLAALCIFAKEGKLDLFTSFEIRMEEFRQKGRGEGYLGINLLQGVPMKRVPCPTERSLMIAPSGSIGITEEEQMEFFRSIRSPRFLEISKATGDAHVGDAYHLWTAEEAALDAFLTMDRAFRNVVEHERKAINSPVLVMTPKELGEHLGLQPVEIERLAEKSHPFS